MLDYEKLQIQNEINKSIKKEESLKPNKSLSRKWTMT